MKTGFRGTFVISWSQTEVDGLPSAPMDALNVGAAWSWHGSAVQVDGPSGVLRLELANEKKEIRQRAAVMVRRLVGAAVQGGSAAAIPAPDEPLPDSCFVVTNGAQSFTVTLIETGQGRPPLLMFVDALPPRGCDLWIVEAALSAVPPPALAPDGGVICFTPGTRIATPEGPRPVEQLQAGDWVQTRDSGAQEILWTGARRMTGARLMVMPHLRPVRIKAGALGIDRPEEELLVSPAHRMLLRGRAALDLFGTPEVLVAARDLVNGGTIAPDSSVREVTYIHLMLSSHQVLWANGVETESFHPASASLSALVDGDRQRLIGVMPGLQGDLLSYGAYARRNLSAPEAAILMHEAA